MLPKHLHTNPFQTYIPVSLGINQRGTNKLNFYDSKWLLLHLYKLEFRIRNQSKFFSYVSLVATDIKLETRVGTSPSEQEGGSLLRGKENASGHPCSNFLLISSAPAHGRGGLLSSKCPLVEVCIPDIQQEDLINSPLEASVKHSINVYPSLLAKHRAQNKHCYIQSCST